MPVTTYTHDEFWLATSDDGKRPLLTAHVCIELDVFRDGSWSIVDVGLVDTVAGHDICCWDIPVGIAALITAAAKGRHQPSIANHVWDVCGEEFGSVRRFA